MGDGLALAKGYKTRPWGKKKHRSKFGKKTSFHEGIGSRFEQMKKSKNEIESFLISSRSGRTDISTYSVFESFKRDF